jgi:hypothetical protein
MDPITHREPTRPTRDSIKASLNRLHVFFEDFIAPSRCDLALEPGVQAGPPRQAITAAESRAGSSSPSKLGRHKPARGVDRVNENFGRGPFWEQAEHSRAPRRDRIQANRLRAGSRFAKGRSCSLSKESLGHQLRGRRRYGTLGCVRGWAWIARPRPA